MNEKYNPKEFEEKWVKYWDEHPELYAADDVSDKEKKFILDMFPYPSGEGLHTGHVESYTATDIISRYHRMNGKNVLHPQGWDAFGLPAENFAIKTKTHPTITTKRAIENFKRQMKMMGFSYDWSREISSTDPEYYKWTQWFFLLLYKNGLAYKAKAKVNWCESCKTVLANEQVENGLCERCKNPVMQKDLEQWFFKITDFIEDKSPIGRGSNADEATTGLISGLDHVDWPESTKAAQKNWIGRSEGAIIKFKLQSEKLKAEVQSSKSEGIEVFTTRLDTIYGATYVVLAPENKLIEELKGGIENYDEVQKYILETKKKSDLDRMENKDKTGVEVKGVKVINPFTKEELTLWVADYVLGQYGTGAVMAVPAHDERDFEFAKKYDLPIRASIIPDMGRDVTKEDIIDKLLVTKEIGDAIEKENIKVWFNGTIGVAAYYGQLFDIPEDVDCGVMVRDFERAKVIIESLGYKKNSEEKKENFTVAAYGKGNVTLELGTFDRDLGDNFLNVDGIRVRVPEAEWFAECYRITAQKASHRGEKAKNELERAVFLEMVSGKFNEAYTPDGIVYESGEYSGLPSYEARLKMTKWLEENNLGREQVNYKIRDWLVSRQRYWGAPIPIIYCEKCGEVPVPEKDLPVKLPTDVDFKPTGESPLKYSKDFHSVKCPKCGADARRESDTMDTFVCSSWYYFRYADTKNDQAFAAKDKIEKWLPVDLYVGGAEHTVLHLLYSRFFTKVLHNLGYIDFDEPFTKLRHQGIILAEDGRKMSKSLGNVVNPDDAVKKFGADALRLFEMFMGPLEDMKPWQTSGIIGTYRFLEKVWRVSLDVFAKETKDPKCLKNTNKAIKKVGDDIENLKFNTAIAEMMKYVNYLETANKENTVNKEVIETLLKILSPFAPFLSEELWSRIGHEESIFKEKWPEYDPELIKDEEIEVVIQINGKVRDKITVSVDISEEEIKKIALEREKVVGHIEGKEVKKFIYVKGRLVSIVI